MNRFLVLLIALIFSTELIGQKADSILLPEANSRDTLIFSDTIRYISVSIVNEHEPIPRDMSHIVRDTVLLPGLLSIAPDFPPGTIAQIIDTLTIIGVGDIMMGTNFPDEMYLPSMDGKGLLQPVSDILSSADLTFGNLEGVIMDAEGIPKDCKDPDLCYLFRSPKRYLQNLLDAGFDVVSTANNHVNDFGQPGRDSTANALIEAGLEFAGYQDKPSVILDIHGLKVGFAAFAPNKGTASFFHTSSAMAIVSELDATCDIVIVSFHAGAEGSDHQHVPRREEVFYGINRGDVYKFSRQMIDAGADIVFGHGPHVTRAVDLYKERFIAYSLGNFCTYKRFNLQGPNGAAPIIKVFTDTRGKFLQARVYSTVQPWPGGPVPDRDQRAYEYIRTLTREDVPEAQLEFDRPFIRPSNR